MADTPVPGSLAWTDLTVPDAQEIRDFYARIIGWVPGPGSAMAVIRDPAGAVAALYQMGA